MQPASSRNEAPPLENPGILVSGRRFGTARKSKANPRGNALRRVIVDLIPLLPGGENGGAKPMTLELVKKMASRAPQTRFVLLTLKRTTDELQKLKQPNMQVIVVDEKPAPDANAARLVRLLSRPPSKAIAAVRRAIAFLSKLGFSIPGWLGGELRGSVLFCPFTAPFFAQAEMPTVSVIHDLQYLDYPQYFDDQARSERHRHFTDACRRANRLVCVSNFVRRRVLEESRLPDDRVITIYTQLARRLPAPPPAAATSLLPRWQLKPGRYLFYPANFWKHKNHEMLLMALGLFVTRRPDSDLKLLCTGVPDQRRDFLESAAERMGLKTRVAFAEYVSDSDFAGFLHNCLALIFPSLYEGFGMPVVEAQALGKPVLCGNVTSLAEVAGGAALEFDPKLPQSIVAAIQQIESDATVGLELIGKGLVNAKRFADTDAMADQYLTILEEVARDATVDRRQACRG